MQFGCAAFKWKLRVWAAIWSLAHQSHQPVLLQGCLKHLPDSSCFAAAFWSPLPNPSNPCSECRGAGAPPWVKPAPAPKTLLRGGGKQVPKASHQQGSATSPQPPQAVHTAKDKGFQLLNPLQQQATSDWLPRRFADTNDKLSPSLQDHLSLTGTTACLKKIFL